MGIGEGVGEGVGVGLGVGWTVVIVDVRFVGVGDNVARSVIGLVGWRELELNQPHDETQISNAAMPTTFTNCRRFT